MTYDSISRLTKATKNAQDVTFIDDKRNRPTSTTDVHGKIVAPVYDATSNRKALTPFTNYTSTNLKDRLIYKGLILRKKG